ncbi:MAG TPA: trypsin-like peptidase domain-containing protein [Candidatus Dormibacteraeota bacterium]|nr:trypsin-like peptidase domain-containing protein [Candidatus Dormibacteraeota bacterium]
MSEMEPQPLEHPDRPTRDGSLLPPASPESLGSPVPSWAPPPPPPPAPPVNNTLWHRIAATVVLAAVIAAAAGVGVGFSLARAINPHTGTAQTVTQPSPTPATEPGSPIQPAPSTGGNLNASAIAAKVDPAIVDINTTVGSGQAAGTGMIITSTGEILTNNHVVDRSTTIQVTIAGRAQTYTAHAVGADPKADIAVIQIDGGVSGLPTITFASSSSVKVGDAVVAIGNALGQGGTPDVSQGKITALDQTITASEGGSKSEQLSGMLQSDATIYPGDSGGPLLNSSGQVVGMITAGNVQGFRSSASNVNYAITSDTILSVVNQIQTGRANPDIIYGQSGYIGVSVQNLDAATASQLGLSVSSGALVAGVQSGSPAAAAGITRNSVITAVAGVQISTIDDLGTTLLGHKPGERVSITWVNQSGTHTATVTLGGVNP